MMRLATAMECWEQLPHLPMACRKAPTFMMTPPEMEYLQQHTKTCVVVHRQDDTDPPDCSSWIAATVAVDRPVSTNIVPRLGVARKVLKQCGVLDLLNVRPSKIQMLCRACGRKASTTPTTRSDRPLATIESLEELAAVLRIQSAVAGPGRNAVSGYDPNPDRKSR